MTDRILCKKRYEGRQAKVLEEKGVPKKKKGDGDNLHVTVDYCQCSSGDGPVVKIIVKFQV